VWTLPAPSPTGPDHLPALSDAAVTLATRGGAHAIIAITREGRTARLLSARRPQTPIFAVTDAANVARCLALLWGVTPVVGSIAGDADAIAHRVVAGLREREGLPSPAVVVIVNTSPDLDSTAANFLRVRRI
jgi:pyruvate kinase